MNVDVMPKNLIRKDDLNKWNKYSQNICKYPCIDKYLSKIIKEWVEKYGNPLQIPWVLWSYIDRLKELNEAFKLLEERAGKETVNKLMNELNTYKPESAYEILNKIHSLIGEITVFFELSKKYKNIRKINSMGDWECNNSIVSVKSKLILDFNYQIIENFIKSLFYIEENYILRKYGEIEIKDSYKNIDDVFLKKIITEWEGVVS